MAASSPVQLFATDYAPADRFYPEEVLRQYHLICSNALLCEALDGLPTFVVVLNRCRQIVYGNRRLLQALGIDRAEKVLGIRPGELFGCVHSHKMPGGCGTSEACRYCGALEAVLRAQRTKADATEEGRIQVDDSTEGFDIRVHGHPIDVQNSAYVLCTIEDIRHEKRRHALERIFFHDVLNTIGGLRSMADLIQSTPDEELRPLVDVVIEISERLWDEVQAQKDLAYAESGHLQPDMVPMDVVELARAVALSYQAHPAAEGKTISQAGLPEGSCVVTTDRTLLARVLTNMLKNALEASKPGDVVTVGCDMSSGCTLFVNNPGVIPRDVQLQLFQRSFSTKGSGRGLGCYSVRLLTERYLGGQVSFTTEESGGTTFRVTLPVG